MNIRSALIAPALTALVTLGTAAIAVAALAHQEQPSAPPEPPTMAPWATQGAQPGDTLGDAEVFSLDGSKHRLSESWKARPVLFVTASLTCPIARGTCPRLESVKDALKESADVVIVYTIEAHPKGGDSPYRPGAGEWVTSDNEKDGILKPQPTKLEDRLALAKAFSERIGGKTPIVVDQMDDTVWKALGAGPNQAVLVDTSGTVRLRQPWLNAKTIADETTKTLISMKDKQDGNNDMKNSAHKIIYSASGHDVTPLSRSQVATLAKKLTPEQFQVTQDSGTERAFCGNLVDNHKDGVYYCVVCGLPLYASDAKFDSGTGWPSFFQPYDPKHVTFKPDNTLGMMRTEINCARCGAHGGHVFTDGPSDKTGLRFCLNSASLTFIEKGQAIPKESQPAVNAKIAYFAGGCFWGIEHTFEICPGVLDAESGYMNGKTSNPHYEDVCSHTTGHAETVKVAYDPSKVTYHQLLEGFFMMHNPTQLNYQGPDEGDQYRSAVFTVDDEQLKEAKAYVAELTAKKVYSEPIVTVIEPARKFYRAEGYHQDFVERTGRACHNVNPWPKIFGPVMTTTDAKRAAAPSSP